MGGRRWSSGERKRQLDILIIICHVMAAHQETDLADGRRGSGGILASCSCSNCGDECQQQQRQEQWEGSRACHGVCLWSVWAAGWCQAAGCGQKVDESKARRLVRARAPVQVAGAGEVAAGRVRACRTHAQGGCRVKLVQDNGSMSAFMQDMTAGPPHTFETNVSNTFERAMCKTISVYPHACNAHTTVPTTF